MRYKKEFDLKECNLLSELSYLVGGRNPYSLNREEKGLLLEKRNRCKLEMIEGIKEYSLKDVSYIKIGLKELKKLSYLEVGLLYKYGVETDFKGKSIKKILSRCINRNIESKWFGLREGNLEIIRTIANCKNRYFSSEQLMTLLRRAGYRESSCKVISMLIDRCILVEVNKKYRLPLGWKRRFKKVGAADFHRSKMNALNNYWSKYYNG
jgi:hypothetical protein